MPSSIKTKRRQAVARWTALLQQHFPSFSRPQAAGLALWSIGIVLAASASLHAVALALALWLPCKALSILKRLQEWYLEAAAKKGHGSNGKGYQRRDWDPRVAPPALLGWILDAWPSRQLVLALDPTNFGDRFTVLNISVLYRGCAVSVMWTAVAGGEPEAWEPHWERMLQALAKHVPAGWQVLVLTDRGMYSPSLFRCLQLLHWHPFLRIRAQGFYRQTGRQKWLQLENLHPPTGQTKAFPAEVFKNEEGRLHCTLLAYHGAAYAEPWLIVTDLSAAIAEASWYGLRGWIEQGYKRVKSEGRQLQRTRITDCARLERLWLAVAVSTMWVLEVGGESEVDFQQGRQKAAAPCKKVGADTPALPDLEESNATQTKPTAGQEETSGQAQAKPQRLWSVFSRGWQLLRNALAMGIVLLASWHPEAWPHHPLAGLPPTPEACANNAEGARNELPTDFCSMTGSHSHDSS
jgi:hypothetical protein